MPLGCSCPYFFILFLSLLFNYPDPFLLIFCFIIFITTFYLPLMLPTSTDTLNSSYLTFFEPSANPDSQIIICNSFPLHPLSSGSCSLRVLQFERPYLCFFSCRFFSRCRFPCTGGKNTGIGRSSRSRCQPYKTIIGSSALRHFYWVKFGADAIKAKFIITTFLAAPS